MGDVGRGIKGRGNWSGWFRDVFKTVEGGRGDWVRENMTRRLGNGEDINFWGDEWCDGVALCERFPRLFLLSREKGKVVREMGEYNPGANLKDHWSWNLEESGCYSVKSAYELLSSRNLEGILMESAKIWSRVWSTNIPGKVKLLTWRILKDRIATKVNLTRRGVCVGNNVPSSNFRMHSEWKPKGIIAANRNAIWLGALWSIWKWRNGVVFEGKTEQLEDVFDLFTIRLWNWIRVKGSFRNHYSINDWINNPVISLR
ncbi:hypothetical protein ACS0TY_003883 [Phlomoides rotata]